MLETFHEQTVECLPEPDFRELPEQWAWVRRQLVGVAQSPHLGQIYGLTDDKDSFLLFHGTQQDRVKDIKSEGMKAFVERDGKPPRIFATASPTMALWHAINRGPHDTLRAESKSSYLHKPDEAVLLAIKIPKTWLKAQPEVHLPIPAPDWLKKAKGLKPEDDNLLSAFTNSLIDEVSSLQKGVETSDFGFVIPLSNVPPEFIKVIESSDAQPIFA